MIYKQERSIKPRVSSDLNGSFFKRNMSHYKGLYKPPTQETYSINPEIKDLFRTHYLLLFFLVDKRAKTLRYACVIVIL